MPTALIRSTAAAPARQDAAAWTGLNATRARKLVPNSRYRRAAGKMAASTLLGIEYIEQAPVLLVGACRGMEVKTGVEIARIAGRFATLVRQGLKLREMLAEYGIAYQFRALAGAAIAPKAESVIFLLSRHPEIKPSALAQAIPRHPKIQAAWLKAMADWVEHLNRRRAEVQALRTLPWAMAQLSIAVATADVDVTVVADYLIANPGRFTLAWSWAQAATAAQRWHEEMREAQNRNRRLFDNFRFGAYPPAIQDRPCEVFDYDPWPVGAIVKEYLFSALDTSEALYEEGDAMRHCVGSYGEEVRTGRSRIYSIRFGEKRVATVEFRVIHPDQSLSPVQLRGPCNGKVDQDVQSAVTWFAAFANRHFSGRSGRRLAESLKVRTPERFQIASPVRSATSLMGC